MYRLRGHHLLCLLGYRGMGYSPEYAENMTRLHQTLRENPETEVLLVVGEDDLCAKFPTDHPYHCDNQSVHVRDAAVFQQLGVEVGQIWTWRDLQTRLAGHMSPTDIPRLCSNCEWLSYGVCEEGVKRINAGENLPIIPASK
ncbi:MAG: DUF1284 domain-containing protein [Tumebacillaceae bacterium]